MLALPPRAHSPGCPVQGVSLLPKNPPAVPGQAPGSRQAHRAAPCGGEMATMVPKELSASR